MAIPGTPSLEATPVECRPAHNARKAKAKKAPTCKRPWGTCLIIICPLTTCRVATGAQRALLAGGLASTGNSSDEDQTSLLSPLAILPHDRQAARAG